MSKPLERSLFILSVLLVCFYGISLAHAMGSKSTDTKSFILQQSYTWHDGDRERTVWLNPQLVAEFNPSPEGRDALKEAYSSAQEVFPKYGSIRLWSMSNNISVKSAIQNIKSRHVNGRYSSVFHDGASSSGRMRALPGNIIVHLEPSWEKSLVDAWLKNNKLKVVRPLNIGSNVFVIKTDSGLVSLEIANKLYESGEVVAAYPDWWKEVATR